MKIQRTLPPAAAPVNIRSIFRGLAGFFKAESHLRKRENELKGYFGVKHVFMVSSGKAALTLILNALKALSPDKTEVIIPAYTCFSVPSAIVKAGLKVSLCDVNNTDFGCEHLERAMNKKTLCVVATHLFGIPSDVSKVKDLCNKRGIFVIEDAAQAMGGIYERWLGTTGEVGFFSLGRGKNVTCGSGGIVITNSDMIAKVIGNKYSLLERPRTLRSAKEFLKVIALAIFLRPSLYWLPAGLPFLKLGETIFSKDFRVEKLSGMQAGILHDWKGRLEKANCARRKNAEYFIKALGLKRYDNFPVAFLRLPFVAEDTELRNRVLSLSRRKGMGIGRMYPFPVNEIKEIEAQFAGQTFPVAKLIADQLLTIPTHELLTEQDRKAICGLCAEALRKQSVNFNTLMQAKS
jgi:perosamine synthetase